MKGRFTSYEEMADNKSSQAEKSGSIILFQEAIGFYKHALKESPNKIDIYLSIMHCYEEIIKLSSLVSQQKKYAHLIIHEARCHRLYDKVTKPLDLFDLHYIIFNAYKMAGEQANAENEAQQLVTLFEKNINQFKKSNSSRFATDYQEALSYLEKNKKHGVKRKRVSQSELSDTSTTTNIVNFYGPIIINQINLNDTIFRKGKEKIDSHATVQGENRVELANGIFFVDDRKSSAKKAGITFIQGVPFHNDVEIVDHGRFTPTHTIEERAKMNEAILPALKKAKKNIEEDEEELHRLAEDRLDIKKTALYMPPIRRFKALAGDLSTRESDKINQIIQSEMDKFIKSNIKPLVIKEHEVKDKPAPRLVSRSMKMNKAQVTFNEAYKAYVNGDYQQALTSFLKTFLLCKLMIKNNHANAKIHKQNLLLIAHYIEYISGLSIAKCRAEKAKTFPEQEDTVTDLLMEDLVYKDPCEFSSITPQSQPSQAEFNYLQLTFPTTDLDDLEVCKAFNNAVKKLEKSHSTRSSQAAKCQALIENHQFRQPREEAKSINSNPLDLYTSINAKTIIYVLNEAQVNKLVTNVCHLLVTHTKEKISKHIAKPKPQAKRVRQYVPDDAMVSVSGKSSTLFYSSNKAKEVRSSVTAKRLNRPK